MLLLSVMCVLLAAAQNPARAQEIEISGNKVTLICTGGKESVNWKKDNDALTEKNYKYEAPVDKQIVKGSYTCEYADETDPQVKVKHKFYLNVKVCENCYELSALKAWGVILGDVLVTGGVILIIYYFSTRNSGSTQKKASTPRSANPPRPPNPDYEALDPKMRSSNAVYAGLNK